MKVVKKGRLRLVCDQEIDVTDEVYDALQTN